MSASWCSQDPALLLSSGKDGRTILWDVPSGTILGEHSLAGGSFGEYAHQVAWSPSNPGLFLEACLGGSNDVGGGKVGGSRCLHAPGLSFPLHQPACAQAWSMQRRLYARVRHMLGCKSEGAMARQSPPTV